MLISYSHWILYVCACILLHLDCRMSTLPGPTHRLELVRVEKLRANLLVQPSICCKSSGVVLSIFHISEYCILREWKQLWEEIHKYSAQSHESLCTCWTSNQNWSEVPRMLPAKYLQFWSILIGTLQRCWFELSRPWQYSLKLVNRSEFNDRVLCKPISKDRWNLQPVKSKKNSVVRQKIIRNTCTRFAESHLKRKTQAKQTLKSEYIVNFHLFTWTTGMEVLTRKINQYSPLDLDALMEELQASILQLKSNIMVMKRMLSIFDVFTSFVGSLLVNGQPFSDVNGVFYLFRIWFKYFIGIRDEHLMLQFGRMSRPYHVSRFRMFSQVDKVLSCSHDGICKQLDRLKVIYHLFIRWFCLHYYTHNVCLEPSRRETSNGNVTD